jgi:hypothetical protein
MSTAIAMAIDQDNTTTVATPPVPNEPNPALPPGESIDVDNEELIDYNEGLNPEEIAALEAAKIQATKVALRDSLASNGLAMRKALRGNIMKGYFASPMTMEEMSIEDMLLEIPTDDLRHVGTIKDRIYIPVHFVQMWVLPTIQVRKALQLLEDKSLPGGIETAMHYSIYDQSAMDLNRSTSANLADNQALRAMVAHAKDDSIKHLSLLKEGIQGQTNGLLTALQRIKEVTHLPNADILWEMSEHDIRTRKEKIAEAIDQYENHTRNDHASMQLLREQCSCLAHLVWEQQLHICDLNDRALRHIDERKRILNGNDAPIHKNVDDIVAVMRELHLSLQRRHEVITGILTPIDMTTIATTMSKLKSALVEITTLNSQLVMRNNKLARELSFMPPAMRQKLVHAKNQRSKIYLEQRTNPHHLIPDTVKKFEFCFVPADMSDPNLAKLQRDETVTSIHELLAEVEDVMCMTGLKFDIPIEIDNNLEQFEDGKIPSEKYDPSSAPKARSIASMLTKVPTCARMETSCTRGIGCTLTGTQHSCTKNHRLFFPTRSLVAMTKKERTNALMRVKCPLDTGCIHPKFLERNRLIDQIRAASLIRLMI